MTKNSGKKLKIALVCDWYLPRIGGIEIHLQELALGLAKMGHAVHVITPVQTLGNDPEDDFLPGNLKIIRVVIPLLPYFSIMISKSGVTKLYTLMAKEKYEVVHSHFSYISPFALAGLYAARKQNIPGIITFHSFIGGFARMLQVLDNQIHWTGWPMIFSAVSKTVAMDVQRACKGKKIFILTNGIDPEDWKIRFHEKKPGKIKLVSVMRLSRKKRGASLVRMFKLLKKDIPTDISVGLTIIGSGFEYKRLNRMIKNLGLDSEITLMGVQSHARIKEVFAASDIFILPTRLESFGIAALEARCAGLPVAAMAHGGVKTFIRNNREGFLAHDDNHMVACLARMINDPDCLARITAHNINTPCPFTWDKVLVAHERLYWKSQSLLQPS